MSFRFNIHLKIPEGGIVSFVRSYPVLHAKREAINMANKVGVEFNHRDGTVTHHPHHNILAIHIIPDA